MTAARLLFLSLAIAGLAPAQATLHVPAQYPTIQAAIVAAGTGDLVLVAAGSCPEAIDFLGKAITVRGAGSSSTAITGDPTDPDGPIVRFGTGEGPAAILERVRIENATPATVMRGIVIEGAGPTIRHCRISVAGTDESFGIHGTNASPVVRACEIDGNHGLPFGYGIWVQGGTVDIAGCSFDFNWGDSGAGVRLSGCAASIRECVFTQNGNEGGIAIAGGTSLIERCVISGNWEQGLAFNGGSHTVVNCLLTANAGAMGPGQAVYAQGASLLLLHCTIHDNQTGVGVRLLDSAATVVNSVVWENGPQSFVLEGTSTILVRHSVVEGGWPGPGNVVAVPFGGNPMLSPCFDGGDPTWPGLPATDLAGGPRFLYIAPDIGADEFMPAGPWPLVLVIAQPQGAASAEVRVIGGEPAAAHLTLLTTNLANAGSGLGLGRWGGLHMELAEVISEILTGGPPFSGTLDPSGGSLAVVALPPGVTGVTVWGVTHTFDLTSGLLSDASPVAEWTLL